MKTSAMKTSIKISFKREKIDLDEVAELPVKTEQKPRYEIYDEILKRILSRVSKEVRHT